MRPPQILRAAVRPLVCQQNGILYRSRDARQLHVSTRLQTDGVFKELTEMRVRTPWIEALRKKDEEGIEPTEKSNIPATPSNRDLTPKRMADSYHRVVRRTADT